MTNKDAWIKPLTTGKFQVISNNILMPGFRNRWGNTYDSHKKAENAIKREGFVYVPGECPLKVVTDERHDQYMVEGLLHKGGYSIADIFRLYNADGTRKGE